MAQFVDVLGLIAMLGPHMRIWTILVKGARLGVLILVGCTESRPTRPPVDLEGAQDASATVVTPPPLPATSTSSALIEAGPPPEPRMAPRSVLHIGDSLVGFRGGLSKALEPRFRNIGSRFASDAWGGVGLQQFERSGRLAELITRTHPDFVMISLGMNNVDAPHPESLVPTIRSVVHAIGKGRACAWIGPAITKPDTGIVEVLRANVAPCRFIDARGIVIERVDGLHPSDRGGEVWAEAIWPKILDAFPAKTSL